MDIHALANTLRRARALCSLTWLSLLSLGIMMPCAGAVENPGIKLGERWSVVGVIAGEMVSGKAPTGIAVLRHNASSKTFTLKVGDSLPLEMGVLLQSVEDRSVTISNGEGSVRLGFAETAIVEEKKEVPTRTARFLESYYRSLDNPGVELLDRDGLTLGSGSEVFDDGRGDGASFYGLSRFGRYDGHERGGDGSVEAADVSVNADGTDSGTVADEQTPAYGQYNQSGQIGQSSQYGQVYSAGGSERLGSPESDLRWRSEVQRSERSTQGEAGEGGSSYAVGADSGAEAPDNGDASEGSARGAETSGNGYFLPPPPIARGGYGGTYRVGPYRAPPTGVTGGE